jgi:hypothetical protein
MTLIIDPDCLACVKCHRVIAKVGTGQAHLVDGGRGGVCCDECRPEAESHAPIPQPTAEAEFGPCRCEGCRLEPTPVPLTDGLCGMCVEDGCELAPPSGEATVSKAKEGCGHPGCGLTMPHTHGGIAP